MPKVKPKYEEMQSKIFLLSEEVGSLTVKLEASEKAQQEQLNFICKLQDEDNAEQLAIEFLTRKLEQIVNVGTSNNMVSTGGNV